MSGEITGFQVFTGKDLPYYWWPDVVAIYGPLPGLKIAVIQITELSTI
jgi:hypothetical protein